LDSDFWIRLLGPADAAVDTAGPENLVASVEIREAGLIGCIHKTPHVAELI
jgi:hypothetical protein